MKIPVTVNNNSNSEQNFYLLDVNNHTISPSDFPVSITVTEYEGIEHNRKVRFFYLSNEPDSDIHRQSIRQNAQNVIGLSKNSGRIYYAELNNKGVNIFNKGEIQFNNDFSNHKERFKSNFEMHSKIIKKILNEKIKETVV